jgi:RNA polymerase sigma-70 factor, ECF subfamily
MHRYQDRGLPFVAFLYRIARNAAIDRARVRRDPLLPLDDVPQSVGATNDVERDAIAGTDKATLMAALSKLKAEHREVLVLRFLEGYSGIDVARMLGKSEGAVRILQHRAMERLRKAFGAAEADAVKAKQ